jgi:alkanesulfonate monooxygenase SsuD/methylene tetrahydromethanopterin reductase-like flavin-dependent oxidoreductase (luciferase family)
MKFGLALDLGSDVSVGRQIADSRPLLDRAADGGVTSVWVGESYHHTSEAFHLPSALITLAHLAALTPLDLGTGVLLGRTYNARRLAYDASLVDQLSEGRLSLGIGLGSPGLRGTLGGPDAPGGPAFDDLLRYLAGQWANSTARSPRMAESPSVSPLPFREGGPRILVGGSQRAATQRAATLAHGYYAATNYSDALLRTQASGYLHQLSAGQLGTVAVNRLCIVDSNGDRARFNATHMFARVTDYYRTRCLWNVGAPVASEAERSPIVAGNPKEVLGRLSEYQSWGVSQVQVRVAPRGVSAEVAHRTLDLLGKEVIPALADRGNTSESVES